MAAFSVIGAGAAKVEKSLSPPRRKEFKKIEKFIEYFCILENNSIREFVGLTDLKNLDCRN